MCAWVLTIAFTVSLCRPSSSRMRPTSSPGSTTRASRVTGSPIIEQLHCSMPTGMEMCRKPCFSAPTTGIGWSIKRSIAFAARHIIACQTLLTAALLHWYGGNSARIRMQDPELAKVIDTPLAPLHAQDEAKMGTWFGCALPDDFGDWRREYWFARKSVALI